MDNFSIGILPKLNNSLIPLQERINLVNHTLDNDKCIIPNKVHALLIWVSKQLIEVYKNKLSLDSHVLIDLWKCFHYILSNSNQKILMPQLLQVFTELFSSSDFLTSGYASIALQSGQIILNKPELLESFTTNFENYLFYLSALLETFSKIKDDTHNEIYQQTLCLFEVSLNLYIPLQRRQTNNKKLFEKACQTILVAMLSACNLNDHGHRLEERKQGVTNHLYQILSDALFRREHLPEYAASLKILNSEQSCINSPEPPTKKAKIGNYTKELFDTLKRQCKQCKEKRKHRILYFIPRLFEEFLKSRRNHNLKSSILEFDFFVEMCSLFGVKASNGILTSDCIGSMYTMLNMLLTYDVYQVVEDNANGKPHFNWFTSLVKKLIEIPSSKDVFKCLQILLDLNHYIIEPYLATLLKHCWIGQKDLEERESCNIFLSSLVRTYSKLRQFDRFVGQMLISLQNTKDMTPWYGFSKQFEQEIERTCHSQPYGLSISLWKQLNKEIIECYLPTLQALAHTDTKPSNNDKETIYRFERVTGLYQIFLLNTTLGKVAEQQKKKAVTTVSDEMCCVHDKILSSAFHILSCISDRKEIKPFLQTCVLALYHVMQEMNVYLGHFGLINCEMHFKFTTYLWDKYVLGYFKENQNRNGVERLIFAKVLIAMQRLRILKRRASSHGIENEAQHLIDYAYNWLDESFLSASSLWNLQFWSVCGPSFDAAYWHTLTSFSPLIFTMSTDKQCQKFISYLIKTLLPQKHDDQVETDISNITKQFSSKTLLFNSNFHQIPSMQKCFVSTLWNEIAQLLSKSSGEFPKKLSQILMCIRLSESPGSDNVRWHDDKESSQDCTSSEEEDVLLSEQAIDNQSINHLLEKLGPTTETSTKIVKNLLSGGHLEKIDCSIVEAIGDHITLIAFLPIDWLNDVSYVGCFLGLLSCDSLTYKVQSEESLRLSTVCQQLLTSVVKSSLSRKRYLIHHVVDLDCLLQWMLMACLLDRDQTRIHSIRKNINCFSKEFLKVLLHYALKIGKSSTAPFEGFIKMVISKLDLLKNTVKDQPMKEARKILKSQHQLIQVTWAIMDILEKVISCKTSHLREIKLAADVFDKCTPSVLGLLHVVVDKCITDKPKDDENQYHVLQENCVIIDIYSAILHIISISQMSSKFAQSKEKFQALQWRPLFDLFCQFSVDSMDLIKKTSNECSNGNQLMISTIPCLNSSLDFLKIVMLSMNALQINLPDDFYKRVLYSIIILLDNKATFKVDIKERSMNVIVSMLEVCTSSMAFDLFKELTSYMGDLQQMSTCIHIWLGLLSGKLYKVRKSELCSVLPQVLMTLQFSTQVSTNLDQKILCLNLMSKIISLGLTMIPTHHYSLVFHGSLLVPMDHNCARFSEVFLAQFSLLSLALFHQSEAVFKAIPVFLSCMNHLLKGLCRFCSMTGSDNMKDKIQEIQNICADKMSRLFQEFASHKSAISKYVPYMIAEYILQIQEHRLQGNIKKLLTPGIYCLIDACGEHEIALLHATLDKGSLELFTSLNNDYKKYHKFQGKV